MISRLKTLALSLPIALAFVSQADASPIGAFISDSFSYSGVVREYGSLSDAQNGDNQIGSDFSIGSQPLDLFINNGITGFGSDSNLIVDFDPLRDPSFSPSLRLYDSDSSTDTFISFSFSDAGGVNNFTLNLEGENTDSPNDLSKFPTVPNPTAGSFIEYALNVTATVPNASPIPGTEFWFSSDFPTQVSGSFNGIFESSGTSASF